MAAAESSPAITAYSAAGRTGTGTAAPNPMHRASLIGVRVRGADVAIKKRPHKKPDLPHDVAEGKSAAHNPGRIASRQFGAWANGAQERTRTFTAVKPLAPEASASTNSATWARAGYYGSVARLSNWRSAGQMD